MNHWIYLAIAIATEVLGTSALKASAGYTKLLPTLLMAVNYGISFYFLSLALKAVPIGVAYAIWSGLGVVLIALIGRFLFDQKLDAAALIGIGFIIAGVAIMNLFSNAVEH
ncbi:DMT family transporter [Marinobacterium arenosum]|uniref:DMT family transporter n=1 Tax=Marinobacterium arenosum TaxID=2862496 RepID=UPI001C982D4F|nr:multidrug efflux SMR transporter [Marinobacterium arenosum]MBY4677500.1 multidrug efflux SMR transporter [Marinobacterium arenosum]